MDLLQELKTDRGQVIGFGRLKIPRMPKLGFDYEIPLLSFVVTAREDNSGYIATCIHLQMDGYGHDKNDAINDMVSNVWHLLYDNFKQAACADNVWDGLYELSKSTPRTGLLWDKYHALQYHFSKKGANTDHYAKLVDRINYLTNRVLELEATLKDVVGDDPYRIIRDQRIEDSMVVHVQYEDCERAA